jgi:ribosomal protein S12 methylthiotransferase
MISKSFSIVTLGCPKNTVDSEILRGNLEKVGYHYIPDPAAASVIIINTCGFIDFAREESIETILENVELRKKDLTKKIIISGCLSQRYPEQLRCELPEVDGIYGVDEVDRIVTDLIGHPVACGNIERVRSLLTPPHLAYLKIAEGCDNRCSFCSIPLMRGRQKSRSIKSLLKEAEYLHQKGIKELILIAQDLTRYGSDLVPQVDLYDLLDQLLALRLFPWVRLLYCNPDFWSKSMNRFFVKYPELCPYLDIPIQHASPRILREMKRSYAVTKMRQKLLQLRRDVPGIALRTSLMVGFPGETEGDFELLLDLVEDLRFERLGVFTYSEEEGTWAAGLTDDVTPAEKERRKELVMQIQWPIACEFAESKIDRVVRVIIEESLGISYRGRTVWDAPEIDNNVLVHTRKQLEIGTIYSVKILKADDFDLVGEVED